MKKILPLIFAVLIGVSVNAQCPLKDAVDFTSVDHNGDEVNLFEILDGGQYVLINFFCTTSVQSQNIEAYISEAYRTLGGNDLDVFFMGVSPTDNINAVDKWVDDYGVEYPILYSASGGTHSGDEIYDMYKIPFYPALILIAPDRKVVIQDIWPVSSAQMIVDALTAYGIEKPEVPEYTDYRNVLIEEFTGRNCSFCPAGHRVANQIAAAYPGRVFPVNIHAGAFALISYPNFNTDDGYAIWSGFDVSGYPTGSVNRMSATAIDRELWPSRSKKQLEQLAEVLIDGQAVIYEDSRVAEIKVDLSYVMDSISDTNNLIVMMLQDYIWGDQADGETNPDQYMNGQYCHMHILRDVVTPTWGDEISGITNGSQITKSYTYKIPEFIGSPNGVEVELDDVYFLAVVTEEYQGTPVPVLNVNKLQNVAGTGEEPGLPEDPENEDPVAPTNVDAMPVSTSSIIITWDAAENVSSYNIYRDGKLLANATSTSYADNGLDYDTEYCYTVTSCRDKIESVQSEQACVKTLGESIGELQSCFNIYPNPVRDEFHISSERNVEEVVVYNVYGQQAYKEQCAKSNVLLTIDVSDLDSGVYFVKVKMDDGESVGRILKL